MFAGAPTVMPTVVWAPEVLPGPQLLMDFVAIRGLCHPSERPGTVLIYTPELREAIVCKFLAKGNYAIARHHCGLNLKLCKVPDVVTLYKMTL